MLFRIGIISAAQVLRIIAGRPSEPLDLEVSSCKWFWRNLCVKDLMGDIAKFEGGKCCGWTPLSSRLELEAKTDAKRLALDEGMVEEVPELSLSGGKDDWQKF